MMINLDNTKFLLTINSLLLPTVRVLSVIISSPIFGDVLINRKIKIVLSLFIMLVVVSLFPEIKELKLVNITILNILEQCLIGVFIGFSLKIIFAISSIIGELVSLQLGLSFSIFFDFHSRSNVSVMSKLFNILVLLLFLSFDGHLWIIFIIIKSFKWIPINGNILDKLIFLHLLSFFSFIFLQGFIFVFPLIIIVLILNFMMSVLSRISPQLSIFTIIFSVTLLLGIFYYCYLSPIIVKYFGNLFFEYFSLVINVLKR